MPRHRPHRFLVALALTNPQVELTDMPRRTAAMSETDDVRRLDEGPFQIPIDVRSHLPLAELVARAMHPRSRA